MLQDNYEIKQTKGEYKDYPFRYTLYLYGTKVWEEDFNSPQDDAEVVAVFAEDLKKAVGGEK